jgi:hypothetical protein
MSASEGNADKSSAFRIYEYTPYKSSRLNQIDPLSRLGSSLLGLPTRKADGRPEALSQHPCRDRDIPTRLLQQTVYYIP